MRLFNNHLLLLKLLTFFPLALGFVNSVGTLQQKSGNEFFHKGSQCFMEQQYDPYNERANSNKHSNSKRRNLILSAGGGFFGGMFSFGDDESSQASAASGDNNPKKKSYGPTNEVVKVVNGIKHRRLGGSDILVSELGLGTQR